MLTHDRGGEELCGRRPCAGERSDRQPLGLQKAPAQRGVGSPTSNHRPTKRAAVRCAEEMLFEKAAADACARAVEA
jgi:hypothetical protein